MKRLYSQSTPDEPQLHIDGYIHLKNIIDISVNIYNEIVRQADKKAKPIFNHHETRVKNDMKRKQTNISTNKKEFISTINNYLTQNVNRNLSISPWVVIKSLRGCGDQASHQDFIPTQDLLNVDEEFMPLAVLIALMPNTKIHVWPKSINIHKSNKSNNLKPIKRLTVTMDEGDLFIFRADCVHAGSSYDIENYRLHAYMDSPHVLRDPNRTYLINRHADEKIRKTIIT